MRLWRLRNTEDMQETSWTPRGVYGIVPSKRELAVSKHACPSSAWGEFTFLCTTAVFRPSLQQVAGVLHIRGANLCLPVYDFTRSFLLELSSSAYPDTWDPVLAPADLTFKVC